MWQRRPALDLSRIGHPQIAEEVIINPDVELVHHRFTPQPLSPLAVLIL